ncbi:MAG: family 1 glycosylhydrolase [Eggerthellaceae bacterium]|nr:family 1 glycosylhydrolase [Eggerthellaceae bacterium]
MHEAVNFYQDYNEHIPLFVQISFNTFCLSINWTRIFPNGWKDKQGDTELEFYDR